MQHCAERLSKAGAVIFASLQFFHAKAEEAYQFAARVFASIQEWDKQLQGLPLQRRNIVGWNGQRVGARLGLEIREADGQHDGPERTKPLTMQALDHILGEDFKLTDESLTIAGIRLECLLFSDRFGLGEFLNR
jgi:hypothetical protein